MRLQKLLLNHLFLALLGLNFGLKFLLRFQRDLSQQLLFVIKRIFVVNLSYNNSMPLDRSSIIMQPNSISTGINIQIKHKLIANKTMRVECNEKLVRKFTDNSIVLLLIYVIWYIIVLFIDF